jgi:putative ATP-dependent DNA ligase
MQDSIDDPGSALVNSEELPEILARARERNRVGAAQLGRWNYLRFTDKFAGIPEGSAVFGDALIWAYPKIGRILWLETGIKAQFQDAFWVEEKVDGYNVRIFRHGDDILALTRRGYVCPFTTDRLPDLLDSRIFEVRPDLVLCAEVFGPENPYNDGSPPFIQEDVQLFVFDVMHQGRSGFIPHREKLELLETYGLPIIPQLGKYQPTDVESLKTLLLALNQQGREGIVLKEDAPPHHRVKYVTGLINIDDIRVSEWGIRQLPAEFFMHRILRLALFMEEHQIAPTPSLYQDLGESLITGIRGAVRQYSDQHTVYRTYSCRFRQRANAELLMQAMRRLLGKSQVRQRKLEKEGAFYRLEFDKVMPKTTGLMGHILSGGLVFD